MSVLGFSDIEPNHFDATTLDATTLMSAAAQEAGLQDFGDQNLQLFLARLLDGIAEAQLSDLGVASQLANLHRNLVNRLRIAADLTNNPQILDEVISKPIFVLGLTRSGTTKLQRLLALDPAVQRLESWRLLNPAPLPGQAAGATDARVQAADEYFALLGQLYPTMLALHPQESREVDEDVLILVMSMCSVANAITLNAPSYMQWMQSQAQDGAYRFERKVLQYLQWQDGGGRNRPWILKSPIHSGHVEAILEVFPDAYFVECHRDLSEAMASACRFMEEIWRTTGHEIDLHQLGPRVLDFFATADRAFRVSRERIRSDRIIDLPFELIRREPIEAVRRVYAAQQRELTPDTITAITKWESESSSRHVKAVAQYSYSLDRYGLDPAAVAEAFGR